MTAKEKQTFLNELIAFSQEKGFVWGPYPEIYGGLSGFYCYAPRGKLLKHKVEETVRKTFQAHNFWEVECPIVLPDIVWKASGHLETFADRRINCEKCHSTFRADKLIEEHHDVSADAFSDKEILSFIKEHKIHCPNCKGKLQEKIEQQSLMMKTKVSGTEASLRPETATVTYIPFKRYYEFFRRKLPFGVFQIGKVFRDEISPRQHLLRGREFTQAEAQLFIDPKEKQSWEAYENIKDEEMPFWTYEEQKEHAEVTSKTVSAILKEKKIKSKAYAWCVWVAYQQFVQMGIPKEKIRLRQHHPDEKAFYADDAWDIEILLNSFGWTEVCGIHDRTDYDLSQHEKFSKENLSATREDGSTFTPHVLEIAFGTDRPVFTLLDVFYNKKEKDEGKSTFAIPYHLAPTDVAVYPLMKKEGMPEKAKEIKQFLDDYFVVEYDQSGSIGKRYLRAAEAGTPYCLTIDHDTLKDNTVTIRDRDSGEQKRLGVDDLLEILRNLLNGTLEFKDL